MQSKPTINVEDEFKAHKYIRKQLQSAILKLQDAQAVIDKGKVSFKQSPSFPEFVDDAARSIREVKKFLKQ